MEIYGFEFKPVLFVHLSVSPQTFLYVQVEEKREKGFQIRCHNIIKGLDNSGIQASCVSLIRKG